MTKMTEVRDDWFFVHMERERDAYKQALKKIAESYWEMSHDNVRLQRNQYKKLAMKTLEQFAPPIEPQEPKELNDDF